MNEIEERTPQFMDCTEDSFMQNNEESKVLEVFNEEGEVIGYRYADTGIIPDGEVFEHTFYNLNGVPIHKINQLCVTPLPDFVYDAILSQHYEGPGFAKSFQQNSKDSGWGSKLKSHLRLIESHIVSDGYGVPGSTIGCSKLPELHGDEQFEQHNKKRK